MSEQPAPPQPELTENPSPEGDPQGDEPLREPGKKALEAERAARARAETTAKELKARLDKIETEKLSDLEKAQREAADAQAALDQITRQNLRNQVALNKGVRAGLVKFLVGDTEDDINAAADELLAALKAPTSPRPDPSQSSGRPSGVSTGPEQDFARFLQSQLGQE